ncbi:outer membrane lipoprotein chaperone LolA [Celerinatantimonas sp. YJH-8]|uniref:outer membrane lipoprotein chaperone LolA n=1 Tax=Celerinatantimonas sp. YJH-8 TaxID=3228714 RepID=UPI0038BE61F3
MRLIQWITVGSCLSSFLVMADPMSDLQAKLQPIEHFSADFQQTVISPEGKTVHQAQGRLVMAKPGKVFWQEQSPGDDQIISDGRTIWYYSPMVEQVSIYNASDAIAHTPFILLADPRAKSWSSYQVRQVQADSYRVTSKEDHQQPTFTIVFNGDAIQEFDVTDSQGQQSRFKLAHFNLTPRINVKQFVFTVPQGVEIDDQRQSHE